VANDDHEINRVAWNEMAEVHYGHPGCRVKEFLEGRSTLHSIEVEELGEVKGKSLLHLMCQFGLDTLSWARRGAIVTGVDISDRSIEYARILSEKAGLKASFIRADVLDLKDELDDRFDIVFQSYGTHCWISDLKIWGEVVVHFLKPGGVFYIVDFHPILSVVLEEEVSYFKKGPYRYKDHPDYCDKEYRIQNQLVEWQHMLSDIINIVIEAGLTMERVKEFDKTVNPGYENWVYEDGYFRPPDGSSRYPLMFSLKARKST
jgi:SAM-dependent methyltransferase